MSRLPVTKFPFSIGEKAVAEFDVRPIYFSEMTDITLRVIPRVTPADSYAVLLQRERLTSQVTCLFEDGTKAPLDPSSLLSLPRSLASGLISMLDQGEGKEGEVLQVGDGITTPVLYKLGTPLALSGGKELSELEFLAPVYNDIEHVLAEDMPMSKARALIVHTSKPVGMLTLPSWAMDKITVADGFAIMQKVLPSFLS